MSDVIDHRRLLDEIDAEVRRRRESGDLPADFERELDLAFARFAPVHAIGDDFDQVLERAEQSTFVDVLAPTQSAQPLVAQVKRVIRKAIIWEVRYVAQQVSGFSSAITRAVRLLSRRVDALEKIAPPPARLRAAGGAAASLDATRWGATVVAALEGTTGRVLHAECGDGALLALLGDAGFDAYGVDPVEQAAPAGVEVRTDEALDHLTALPDGGLGALVLSGCVERLPVGAQADLAALAAAKVATGGAVVVLSADPRGWAQGRSAVEADLSSGRPLRSETWCHLFRSERMQAGVVAEIAVPSGEVLQPVPGADPVLAANIARLNEVLFPPAAYAVVATRR
ncbi:MAG TPA: hypothetical protein VHM89_06735 [Acidimicrobiales bacterium]|nr:hypothetical protein [Acidimicrobiales bacterium]